MSHALLFSPQGSQTPGMGRELAEASPAARAVYAEADATLGWSVSATCWTGPAARLDDTRQTQPCLLATSVAAYRALLEARRTATGRRRRALGRRVCGARCGRRARSRIGAAAGGASRSSDGRGGRRGRDVRRHRAGSIGGRAGRRPDRAADRARRRQRQRAGPGRDLRPARCAHRCRRRRCVTPERGA